MSTASASTRTAPRIAGNSMWTDILVVCKRNLLRIMRTPQLLVFASIQPVMFVLLFRYVFGGSIQLPGYVGRYADYLLPGIMTQLSLFGGQSTALGLNEDTQKGIVDRFRSLPMARSAVLAGRVLADAIKSVFVVLLIVGVGHLVGFRFHNGFLGAIGAIGITVLFGFAFSWFFAFVGLAVKNAEAVQVASFLPIFPLIFAASTFTSTSTFPGWLQAFARVNPVTNAVNAIRALAQGNAPVERFDAQLKGGGFPRVPGSAFNPESAMRDLQASANIGRNVLYCLIWCAVITAIFAPLAIRRYRRGD